MSNFILSNICKVCQSESLRPIVSLGKQKIVDFVSDPSKSQKPIVPLELIICSNCRLVQLRHIVNPDVLFTEFWYRSGINEQMRAALLDVVTNSYSKAKA